MNQSTHDRLKILVWDDEPSCATGSSTMANGMVLICKVLEQDSFAWPKVQDGVMRLSRAQVEALFEGLDWRRTVVRRVAVPTAAGLSVWYIFLVLL